MGGEVNPTPEMLKRWDPKEIERQTALLCLYRDSDMIAGVDWQAEKPNKIIRVNI